MHNRIVRIVPSLLTFLAVALVGACESNAPGTALSDTSAAPPLARQRAGYVAGKASELETVAAPAPARDAMPERSETVPTSLLSESRPGQTFTLPAQQTLSGAMLVRTGEASVQVDSLEIGIERVRVMAQRTGAIIANTSMQGGKDQVRAASVELRIPSQRFDEAISGLAPIGTLESVNVSVQDVGEEYVDLQARVTNARRLEQRLIELLANRTGKLSDVMSVERELARVREEIERYEGRLRYLANRASVSTLTVSIHEPPPLVANRPGAHPIRDAFVQAWRNVVSVTAAIIASLGILIPIGLLGALVIFVGRRILGGRLPALDSAKPAEPGHA